jgi:hypothetical protein
MAGLLSPVNKKSRMTENTEQMEPSARCLILFHHHVCSALEIGPSVA